MVSINLDDNDISIKDFKLLDCEYVAEQETTAVKETALIPDDMGNFTGINTRFVKSTVIKLKPVLKNYVVDENDVITINVPNIETTKRVNLIPPLKGKK